MCEVFAHIGVKRRIAGRRLLGHTVTQMISTHVIKTRVSPDVKVRVNEEAQRQLLTESVWLRRVVDAALRGTPVAKDALIRRVGLPRIQWTRRRLRPALSNSSGLTPPK